MVTAVSACPPTCCRPSAITLVPTPMSASTSRVVSFSTPTGPEEAAPPPPPPTTFKSPKVRAAPLVHPGLFHILRKPFPHPPTTVPSKHEKESKQPPYPSRAPPKFMRPAKRRYHT